MLEAGSVRTKNAAMICMKNIGLYAIAGLAYYVIGYNLMYVDVGRDLIILGLNLGETIGAFGLAYGPSAAEVELLEAEPGASAAGVFGGVVIRRHVRLVLPDGLCGHHGLHRVRGLGRAG